MLEGWAESNSDRFADNELRLRDGRKLIEPRNRLETIANRSDGQKAGFSAA